MTVQTLTVEIKESPGWTTDDGTEIPPHNLFRFRGPNGGNEKGCWYSTVENARKSYERNTTDKNTASKMTNWGVD